MTLTLENQLDMPAHIHSVDDMGEGKKCASLSDALLRDYATNLDPLNTNASSYRDDDTRETMSNASTQVNNSPQDLTAQLPLAPAVLPGRASQSFRAHRKGTLSTDSIPRPTIMKSLNSPPPSNGHHPSLSLNAALSSRPNAKEYETENQYPKASAQHLSTTLSDLKLSARTPAMARFASLQSPCYFHQRFDDAVNIDRVLEEIAADENGMSHSRLIQTATSVREISKQLQRRPIKRAVRSIMIITKARDNSLVYLTRELTEWLLKTPRYNSYLGVTVYVDAKLRTSKRFNAASLLASNPGYERMLKYWTPDLCYKSPEKFDLVLTLGGDGTVLFTSWLFQRIVPPVLSFSLGSLGFLTNFEFSSYKTHLDRIMGDHGMRVNLRMRFTCTIIRAANRGRASQPPKTQQTLIPGGQNNDRDGNDSCGTNTDSIEDEQFEVLNELVIDRGPSPYVSNLELYGDNELLTVVQADGCIISTPTGSTAYSLSAGGPLTHPSIPGIVLTPICPHTLSFRPMVLSDTLLLRICVPRSSRSTAYASFDGKGRVELRRGDCVQVEAGKYPFPTVVGEGGTGGEWFESVRRALRWNNRGAVQKAFGGGAESAAKQTADVGADVELDEEEGEEEEEWDIDADPIDMGGSVDSGIWLSEGSSTSASPGRRKEPRTGLMGASGCSSVPWRSMKLVS